MNFTEEEVIAEAKRVYGAPVCLDLLSDAMEEPTLEDAVMVIVIDSQYWDMPI